MTKDNSTGKNKDFYELGKKMFDRLNPHIAHNPKVIGPEQEPVKMVAYNCTCGRTMKFESVHGVVAPQRTWVGLTDEDCKGMSAGDKVVATWADRTLKEKNT